MAGEERVLTIEDGRADAALDDVRVELDAAVVEEADEPFPVVQTIAELLGDSGLAGDARQLMLKPWPKRHDKRFALHLDWQRAAVRPALLGPSRCGCLVPLVVRPSACSISSSAKANWSGSSFSDLRPNCIR